MKALLVKPVIYFDINDARVVLKPGTEVTIDEQDNTACYQGDHFEILTSEYEYNDSIEYEAEFNLALH